MIFFVANDGTIIKGMPSPVYQGAANSNTIYLIAPFASNTAVAVAFRLPNGVVTSPAAMTAQNALQGIVNAETGQTYAGWTYDLPNGITEMYGTVTVQFFFYSAEAGVITPTSSTSFEVGRGVPAVLPDTPEDDVYENILSNLAALQTQLNNGSFASRAIYNWNASYTYGAGEVTFYPDIGTYGAFVKSVQAGNTNHAPYTDGAVNSAWWSEVVNFNTVTDDFFAEIKAVQTAAEAAQSAAETAQGKAEDAQAAAEEAESGAQTQAQAAASSATAAEESADAAESAKVAAQTAQNAAESAEGNAQAYAEQASSSAGDAAQSASAAAASANRAQEIVNGIGSVYKPVGSIAFSALPAAPAAAQQGYVYNMTDAFTTDARFVEGAGKEYPAGTNVAVVLNGSAYMYDALSGNVDLSNYAQTDGTYPNMTVGNATQAGSATKATQDGNGNNISATYATASEVSALETQIAGKYTKPSTGIPESDLSEAVQTKLNSGGGSLYNHNITVRRYGYCFHFSIVVSDPNPVTMASTIIGMLATSGYDSQGDSYNIKAATGLITPDGSLELLVSGIQANMIQNVLYAFGTEMGDTTSYHEWVEIPIDDSETQEIIDVVEPAS